jgi:tyrosyl-tRNA synthetase
MNAIDVLEQRGFLKQCTGKDSLVELFTSKRVTFYAGFDPTSDSLHVGSLVPIMAMSLLQKLGHRPIAVIGGGTTMIGDPSGKTEMRRMLTREEITSNGTGILSQLKRYLSFGSNDAIFADNADWLIGLNYIEFLRNIGRHFKVNEMIRTDAYCQRLERQEGLSFIEFNYQLLQAYDFLVLFDTYNCILQIGGDDQWSNILAGTELVRKTRKHNVLGLTLPLITTATGRKMGKTESGAIWLDEARTSVYDFYQYWINTDDRDVERFLKLFTELSLENISVLCNKDEDIRHAKEVLAFEATKLAHGEEKATKTKNTSRSIFGGLMNDLTSVPTIEIDESILGVGISVTELFCKTKLTASKSAANRLIEQGGAYVNEIKVNAINTVVNMDTVTNGYILLRKGKKTFYRIVIKKGW